MIYLVLHILFAIAALLVPGVIALVRAAGSPSGRGLVLAGGGLLVLCGLISIGYQVWYQYAVLGPFGDTVAGGPLPHMELVNAYAIARPALVAVAIALLLFAVLSARGTTRAAAPAAQGFPQHPPVPGHHVPPHHPRHPGQPYGHRTPGAPQPPFQPPQAPTGPQQPQGISGPQMPQPPQGPQPGQR